MEELGRSLIWLLPLLPYAAARWVGDNRANPNSLVWPVAKHLSADLAVSLVCASESFSGLLETRRPKADWGVDYLNACGLMLGALGAQRVRRRWTYGLVWTAVRLLVPYMLWSTPEALDDNPPFMNWLHKSFGVLAFLALILDTLQMVVTAYNPSSNPQVLILISFATSINILAWGLLAQEVLLILPILLLGWFASTVVLTLLVSLALLFRVAAYGVGGIPAPALLIPHGNRADLTLMSFPGMVAYTAYQVSARLGPPRSLGVNQIDPSEGLSTLVGLGPANRPAPQEPSATRSRLLPPPDLGVSHHAEVRPTSSTDAGRSGGFASEVRNIEVVPPSQINDEADENFYPDWDGSTTTLILLYRTFLTVRQQLGHLYLAIAWRMLGHCKLPLEPLPAFQELNPEASPQELRLRCSLLMINEEEAWAKLESPPALANVERTLRLFWSGTLGENNYRLRIVAMRQSLAEQKEHILADLDRLANPSSGDSHDGEHANNPDLPLASLKSTSSISSSGRGDDREANGYPTCVVCYSAPRTILLWPCRCVNMCEGCRVRMAIRTEMSPKPLCPTCRAPVRGFSRLYFP